MTLTTRRWRLTLVAIVATALGATLLADGGDSDPMSGWLSSRSAAGYRRQRPIANALQREGSLALREALYTLAIEARISPTPRAATDARLQLIAADSIAARHLPTVRRVVDREWSSLGIGAQGRGDAQQTPLRVIVVGELPDAVPVRFAPATRDASVGRFVLVPRTASDRAPSSSSCGAPRIGCSSSSWPAVTGSSGPVALSRRSGSLLPDCVAHSTPSAGGRRPLRVGEVLSITRTRYARRGSTCRRFRWVA